MPELPEVETVRRGLAPVMEGRTLARVILRRENLRFPFPDGFGQMLTGRKIESISRRAKYLLFHLQGGVVMIAHLGMSGRFRIFTETPPAEEKHDHVIFETNDGTTIRYNDPRRFGFMLLTTTEEMACHPLLEKLGPEPVDLNLSAAELARQLEDRLVGQLKGRKSPIKTVLLDQTVIAGLGNIYVCEALFRAGISPQKKADRIKRNSIKLLAPAIVDILQEAIKSGGSSLRDHRQPSGELGYFQHRFAVYGKEGEACPKCGPAHPVRRITQSGRSTFYCAACQKS